MTTDELELATESLTPGQLECLMLVHQHFTSKEIGPRLVISPHTVDQRIRSALRILGCKNRHQAARLVASRIPPEAMFKWQSALPEPFVESGKRPSIARPKRTIPMPFATTDYPSNEMSIPLRLLWIVAIGC
jgi:DNA-binding CsgD family transcriptional regulator